MSASSAAAGGASALGAPHLGIAFEHWSQHLPVLAVLLPLTAAPLCVIFRNARIAWWIATVAALGGLGIAIALLPHTAGGVISYAVGGWAPPYGIELRIDRLNNFVLLLIAAVSAAALPYARVSVEREVAGDRIHLFYGCLLLCIAGLTGITVTGDAFNVFVFLEISSLSTYALIAMGRSPRALTAAYRYLIMGTIGGTFFLIGIGLLYGMTGTLNMADMATRLDGLRESRTVLAAAAFILVGIGLKLAMFPLHSWLPNAYTYAPSVVTALVAGTGTKVAVYVLLRFYYTVMGVEFSQQNIPFAHLLMAVGICGLLVCSLVAVFEQNVKRLLAYSSVAQIGYILIGISLVSATGMTAAVIHLFNHAIIKAALFLAIGAMVWRRGDAYLTSLAGVGRNMPLTTAAFVVGGLGLIGVPTTAGFVSKWYLVLAALDQSYIWLAALLLGTSLLALIYVGKVIEVAYFRPAPEHLAAGDPPAAILIPLWLLAIATVVFGVQAESTVTLANQAADTLLSGVPAL